MKKHLSISNILFVLVAIIFLYTPSRIWVIRQFSFSPSIENVQEDKKVTNYNWGLKGLNTPSINFEQYKGKVIFLNFWATWCPPCVAELPYIQSFYNDYEDKVEFVFVSNESWSDIDAFFKKNNYDFKVYNTNNILEGLPEVNSIPRTFIIDKKGNIRIDKSGSANWNSDSFRSKMDLLLQEN